MAGSVGGAIGEGIGREAIAAGKEGYRGPVSRTMQQIGNKVVPNELPSASELFHAYRTGWITARGAQNALWPQGIAWEPPQKAEAPWGYKFAPLARLWKRIYLSQRPQPSVIDMFTLMNRGVMAREEVNTRLQHIGFDSQPLRTKLLNLADEIPGPSDLARFAVRHVWEPDLLEELGYKAELRPAFAEWLAKQGFAYDARTDSEKASGREPYTWADAFWWSHWILPSAGQGYEMVQRLRPTGGPNGGARDPSGEVMPRDTLKLLLRAQDIPPFWREKLIAIAYRPIGLRQLRQLYLYGQVDDAELVERWQDLGYERGNAEKLSAMQRADVRAQQYRAEITGAKARVVGAYQTGTIDRNEAARRYFTLTLPTPDMVAKFQQNPIEDQDTAALNDPGTRTALEVIDFDRQAKMVKSVIAAVKRQFLRARISRLDAQTKLVKAGIITDRAGQYLDSWELEFDPTRREMTAAKLQDYARRGIISGVELGRRLLLLGYADNDIPLLLAEVNRNVALDIAKAQTAAAKSEAERIKAQQAAVKAAKAAHREAISNLARSATPAMLKAYLKKGIIDENAARRRLTALDWPFGDIELWVQEATAPKAPSARPVPAQG